MTAKTCADGTPVAERIHRSVVIDANGCWNWQLRRQQGYGRIALSRAKRAAHRVSYETFVGPIPAGLHLDHVCRNRACVNPAHLEPVTSRVNTLRSPIALAAVNAEKTACHRGHLFTVENTYIEVVRRRDGTVRTKRKCRVCPSVRVREDVLEAFVASRTVAPVRARLRRPA